MLCAWCDEEVEARQRCQHFAEQDVHHECGTRMVVGSAGHLLGLCSCHGGTLEDPPGLSKRAAAQLAMRVFMVGQKYDGKLPKLVKLGLIAFCFPNKRSFLSDFVGAVPKGADFSRSITCPKCGRTSWNPNDVQHRYCGACHEYHDDMDLTPEGD